MKKLNEKHFRNIVEQNVDSIIVLSRDGIVIFVNPATEPLFDRKSKELEGEVFGFPAMKGETSEIEIIHRDRKMVIAEMRVGELKCEKEIAYIISLRNITKRKSKEKELRVSQKMASIGRLASNLFHEILNPVNIISAHVQLLMMEAEKGSNTEKDLKSIMNGVERIVDMTDGILKYSRKKEGVVEETEINDLLKNTLSHVGPELDLKSIKPVIKFEKDLPDITAHEGELRQVFLGIIKNAIEAMPDGGTLTVKTLLKGDYVIITFADTGYGISKTDIDKVFEPFFSTKKDKVVGVGMGMSTSFMIIEGYGGKISVKSVEGKGTTFTIDLPVEKA